MTETARLEAAGHWLIRLQEDDLSEAEMVEWMQWGAADPRNLQAFEELQSLAEAASAHAPPPSVLTRLLQADPPAEPQPALPSARPVPGPRASRLRRYFWPAIAATAAVACVAGWLAFETGGSHRGGALRAATVDTLRTRLGANQSAVLPDGSNVDIGARSVIEVDFRGPRRRLQLKDGQAFFKVRHASSQPFVVNAGEVEVVAVGTAFDVRRSRTEVAVTVQEGVVNVIPNGGGAAVRTPAGYQAVFDIGTRRIHRAVVDTEAALAWRDGRLEFNGDSLDAVVASVNRYSQRRVIIRDRQLGQLAFTGTVFIDSIDASLDALAEVFPLEVQRNEREVILTARPD
jgi:transmembrane sensor